LHEQSGATGKVVFFTPDEFILKLRDWALEDPEGGETEKGKRRKQSINLDGSDLSVNERRRSEKEMLKTLEERMKANKSG
jgi:hypothetical protein